MNIESRNIRIALGRKEIFDHFTTSYAHYKDVMPEDVEHFESDDTSFVFGLRGLPKIRLVGKENKSPEEIVLGAASSKLDFELKLQLKEISDNETEAQFFFEGNFNAMMRMMVEKPLRSFIDKLADQLEKLKV